MVAQQGGGEINKIILNSPGPARWFGIQWSAPINFGRSPIIFRRVNRGLKPKNFNGIGFHELKLVAIQKQGANQKLEAIQKRVAI